MTGASPSITLSRKASTVENKRIAPRQTTDELTNDMISQMKRDRASRRRLVFLGPPGVGKGTQAKLLCQKYGMTHLATGDILREEIVKDSPLGRRVAGAMAAGHLVPDEDVVQLVRQRIHGIPGGFVRRFRRCPGRRALLFAGEADPGVRPNRRLGPWLVRGANAGTRIQTPKNQRNNQRMDK